MDYSLFYILIFGIVVGAIISIVAFSSMNKDKKLRTKYDERQKIARGKSYMYGFYAMVFTEALMILLSVLDLTKVFGHFSFFLVMTIGIIVQFSYAIFHDAYIGLNTNLKKYLIFMSFVTFINLMSSVAAIASGEIMKDGVLQTPFMNVLCTVMFAVLAVELGIKSLIDKKA